MAKAALRKAATNANPVAINPTRAEARGESDGADDGEHESDQLRELQRRHRLLLGDRCEPGGDELREDQAVRVLAWPAERADREHDGLHAEDHGGGAEAEARDDQRDHQNRRGHPRGESGSTNVDLVDVGRWSWRAIPWKSHSCCVG